jgi:hypothetical protein
MRKSIVLIIASILICTVPAVAVAKSGAALLSTCIANYDRCFRACYDPDGPLPPDNYAGYCFARCDANHAACVDRAFDTAVGSRALLLARRSLHRR